MRRLRRAAVVAALAVAGFAAAREAVSRSTEAAWRGRAALAHTRNGPIEVYRRGTGPAVLLLHGSPGGWDQLRGYADILAREGYEALSVSRPGYLGTPLSTGRTPEEQADALAALLDTLQLRRAVVWGLSGGGPAALAFALRHGTRTTGLVLIAAVSGPMADAPPTDEPPAPGLAADTVFLAAELFPALGLRLLGVTDADQRRRLLGDPELEGLAVDLFRSLGHLRLRRAGYRNDYRHAMSVPSPDPAGIRAPTLILHGEADRNVPISHGERVAAVVPGARLVRFPGAAHGFFVTDKDALLTALLPFLERITRSERTESADATRASGATASVRRPVARDETRRVACRAVAGYGVAWPERTDRAC